MVFKKSFSFLLILSQFAAASVALGDSSAPTPEVTLISSALALQGQKLSNVDLQKQLASQIHQYNATAPVDGRTERTQQALVSLGVFTPSQAKNFEAQIQAASESAISTHFASAQAAQLFLSSQLTDIVSHSAGAQFSSCDVAIGFYAVGMSLFAVGLGGSVIVNWGNIVNGDGTFAKDGWLADMGIAGVFVALVGTVISADGECFQ